MITFLANNWYWLLLVGAMVFMHAGHGGHGGHSGHGGGAGGHGGAAGGHCGGSAHQGAHPQESTNHEAAHRPSAAGGPPTGSPPR